MAWIESHQALGAHPKTRRVMQMLSVRRSEAVGILHLLWWWALDYAPDGDLRGYSEEDIAAAVEWEGDPSQLVDALVRAGGSQRPGFLDRGEHGLTLHDWDDYAGKLLDQKERNAERMREARRQQRLIKEGARVPHVPDTLHARVGLPDQPTGPDLTGPTQPTYAHGGAIEQNGTAAAVAPNGAALASRSDTKVTGGDDRRLWDAFSKELDAAPKTASERGKWNRGIRELREAGVTVANVPALVANYRTRFKSMACNPRAIANNLSEIRGPAMTQAMQANGSRAVDRSELAGTVDYVALYEQKAERERRERDASGREPTSQ